MFISFLFWRQKRRQCMISLWKWPYWTVLDYMNELNQMKIITKCAVSLKYWNPYRLRVKIKFRKSYISSHKIRMNSHYDCKLNGIHSDQLWIRLKHHKSTDVINFSAHHQMLSKFESKTKKKKKKKEHDSPIQQRQQCFHSVEMSLTILVFYKYEQVLIEYTETLQATQWKERNRERESVCVWGRKRQCQEWWSHTSRRLCSWLIGICRLFSSYFRYDIELDFGHCVSSSS